MHAGIKKLPAEWQADSKISNIISDFMSQRMLRGVGGAACEGRSYPDRLFSVFR